MYKWTRTVVGVTIVAVLGVVLVSGSATIAVADDAEPAPPEGQEYIGSKKCASCHFDQFMTWKKDKHSKSFELLPKKYQADAECLKCHSAGHGEPTGFKDIKSTPNLAGTTCEVCHGPGSKHEEICKPFAKAKSLTDEQEKTARDSIWMVRPGNICITCHKTKAHGKSSTPKDLIKKKK